MTTNKLFFLFFISLLSSCSNHKIIFNTNINHNTNILVISEYSDTLHIDVIGSTIFGNGRRDLENFGIKANKTILDHLSNKKNSAHFIPYDGDQVYNLQEFNLHQNIDLLSQTAK